MTQQNDELLLTDEEINQGSLLSEDDCLAIERLHKSYGADIFYGESDSDRHSFAVDMVVGQKIAKAQAAKLLKAGYVSPEEHQRQMDMVEGYVVMGYEEKIERIISELDRDFRLAPDDDAYLRILVKDTLEFLRAGQNRKQRADEECQKSNKC